MLTKSELDSGLVFVGGLELQVVVRLFAHFRIGYQAELLKGLPLIKFRLEAQASERFGDEIGGRIQALGSDSSPFSLICGKVLER